MITLSTLTILSLSAVRRVVKSLVTLFLGNNPGSDHGAVREALLPRIFDVVKDVLGTIPAWFDETLIGSMIDEALESLEENELWVPGQGLRRVGGRVSDLAGDLIGKFLD
jgi:hypothetical protein